MKKKAKLIARQQEITDLAQREGRDLTAEEQREFDELQVQIDAIRDDEGGESNGRGNAEAVTAERQRISDVITLCREFDMDATQFIQDGTSLEDVRSAVLDHIRKNGAPVGVRVTESEGDKFRAAAADALVMRSGVNVANAAPGAADLRHLSLRELAIECMVRENGRSAGELYRMDKDTLFNMLQRDFYNPTAAFPAILDSAIRKQIVHIYNTVPTTFERITSEGSLSDFKATKDHNYIIGGTGDFLLVPENGELKADKPRTEMLPERKLDTYGRQFSMTRQAFINDDISFLSEVPGQYAASAKRTINKQVYKILVENPVIYDGVALFDAAHKNLVAAGTGVTNAAIQKLIMLLGMQTDPFGEAINIPLGSIVVPMGYGFTMRTILESRTINTADNQQAANPLYGYPCDVVEEPTINVLAGADNPLPWFATGAASAVKGIQVDYLNGQKTPIIRRMEKPGTLGFVWDIYLDWGICVRDFRGLAKNPGIKLDI